MPKAKIRSNGVFSTLSLSESVLAAAGLKAGDTVDVVATDGGLTISKGTPRYTLAEMLDQCDFTAPMSEEERVWLNDPPVGRELI